MLTIAECRAYLEDQISTDDEILAIRDSLYSISEQVIGKLYDTMTVCQNEHLSIAGSHQSSSESKDMVSRGKNTDAGLIVSPKDTR